MALFDTHCHLSHPALHTQLPEVLAAAAAADVRHFLAPATGAQDWGTVAALAQPHIHIALGIHPWFIDTQPNKALDLLAQQLQTHAHALVGEIGLDHYPPHQHNAAAQSACFEAQLQLAQQLQRPVVLHNRKASQACLHSIRRCGFTQGGFAHAFSGSLEEARQWIKHGFKIGIGSVLLKPQAKKIRTVVAGLDWADMVLETDAPYMPPHPDSHNHPQNTRRIAEIVAAIKHTDWQTVAYHTTRTALALIGTRA